MAAVKTRRGPSTVPGVWSAPQLSIPLPLSLPPFLFLFEHQNHLSPIRGCPRLAFQQVARSILEKPCLPAGAWREGSGWLQLVRVHHPPERRGCAAT